MTTIVTANIHFDKGDVWHRWNPGNDQCNPYGALKFGRVNEANVFFKNPEQIDEVIAELVALRAEMDPPVITDSEPAPTCETCGATEDLEKTLWLSMADHSERARYFCNDRRACNDRRFPEMAALLASGPCASTSPESGFRCSETGEHTVHRSRMGMITWPVTEPAPSGAQGAAERRFDVGVGNRELSGPGRDALRQAIAEEDVIINATEYREPAQGAAEMAQVAERTPGAPLCDSELPLRHGGVLKCTLDDYHDGPHSAIGGERRWLGTGNAARDENGNRITEPASVTA